jgi:DNA helicase-2/ATP-dependent DNA helicase PcrA
MVAKTRRVVGLSEADDSFDPESYRGRVIVTTSHKAKGLEWDRVYLMSVNNYDFPSADPNDTYQGELFYVRNNLNLQAETLGMLETLATGFPYQIGDATRDARLEYASERLRLLYVGITRARRELRISTNTGKSKSNQKHAARPIVELKRYLDSQGRANK